ncbi:MAG: DUF1850 domain-containing protein [Desulfovibrio sp.]|nr:DUF1850 domain-containing protein [Desulfovibrio sp.]
MAHHAPIKTLTGRALPHLFLLLFFHIALLFSPETLPAAENDLVLQDSTGKILARYPIPDRTCFGILFIHSVAKSPVEEWFCRQNSELFLEKTVYQDFGAGLPYRPEGGQRMRVKDGHIIIDGYHRPLPRFDVRVGRIAGHTLLLPEHNAQDGSRKEVRLDSLAKPGSAITFSLENPDSTRKEK